MDQEELKTYNENMQMFGNGGPQFDDITGELKTNNTKTDVVIQKLDNVAAELKNNTTAFKKATEINGPTAIKE